MHIHMARSYIATDGNGVLMPCRRILPHRQLEWGGGGGGMVAYQGGDTVAVVDVKSQEHKAQLGALKGARTRVDVDV